MSIRRRPIQLMFTWLTLVIHLLAVSGLAQAGIAVLAAMEGSHHLGIQSSDQGKVLVLAHDRDESICRSAELHQAGARHSSAVHTLLWMAQPDSAEQDHVFALTTDSRQLQRSVDRMVVPPAKTLIDSPFQILPLPIGSLWSSSCPPPFVVPSHLLLAVDSIVLLI